MTGLQRENKSIEGVPKTREEMVGKEGVEREKGKSYSSPILGLKEWKSRRERVSDRRRRVASRKQEIHVREVVVDEPSLEVESDLCALDHPKTSDYQLRPPFNNYRAAGGRLTSMGISSLMERVTLFANGADFVKLSRYLSENVDTTDCCSTIDTPRSSSSSSPFFTDTDQRR